MTRRFVLFAAVLVAGCSGASGTQSAVAPLQTQPTLQSNARADARTAPKITKVSRIFPTQTQTITISGYNFGTSQPYNGDSPYLWIIDNTGGWQAGFTGNSTTLNVTSWTDRQIVIAGFTGSYYKNPLHQGDWLMLSVTNPQTGKGPAYALARVQESQQPPPRITKISRMLATQTQTITISGFHFGTSQPYNGDSPYLWMLDETGGAGRLGPQATARP